ncbi:hypothetical protein QJS10_CPB17g00846 [Acorus calamus]|uniref:Uncharacterized protein n=1 Tax=Acorus calamus TaxID=4465 RepID=A0AAV9CW71_ACOCL|nr:hypothetical protein QJS10_CPB17g00846 [Acorus calamus]
MASWVRTITSPFRKACTILNISKDQKKSRKDQYLYNKKRSMDKFHESPILTTRRGLIGVLTAT